MVHSQSEPYKFFDLTVIFFCDLFVQSYNINEHRG